VSDTSDWEVAVFEVETRTPIDRAPGEVFAFVADQTNAPRWQQGLRSVRRLDPGPIGMGSEHVFVRRFAGRVLESRNRFVAYEPPRRVEFEIPAGWLSGRASYEVEPRAAGSLLISRMEFRAAGPGRLLEPLLARLLEHDARRDEDRLKQLLERSEDRVG
jgi:Polyketide cyclase / dehydrase and lipid transport